MQVWLVLHSNVNQLTKTKQNTTTTKKKPLIKSNFHFLVKKPNRNNKGLPQLHKIVYVKPTVNIILNDERLNAFPLRSERRQGFLQSIFLFNLVPEVLISAIRQEK